MDGNMVGSTSWTNDIAFSGVLWFGSLPTSRLHVEGSFLVGMQHSAGAYQARMQIHCYFFSVDSQSINTSVRAISPILVLSHVIQNGGYKL